MGTRMPTVCIQLIDFYGVRSKIRCYLINNNQNSFTPQILNSFHKVAKKKVALFSMGFSAFCISE